MWLFLYHSLFSLPLFHYDFPNVMLSSCLYHALELPHGVSFNVKSFTDVFLLPWGGLRLWHVVVVLGCCCAGSVGVGSDRNSSPAFHGARMEPSFQ